MEVIQLTPSDTVVWGYAQVVIETTVPIPIPGSLIGTTYVLTCRGRTFHQMTPYQDNVFLDIRTGEFVTILQAYLNPQDAKNGTESKISNPFNSPRKGN